MLKNNRKKNSSTISSFKYLKAKSNEKELKSSETDTKYRYELKIPGYIKEDFSFYLSYNELVVTTEKIKSFIKSIGDKVSSSRHTYCYPSAYFKMKITLPGEIIRDKISVNYNNEVLCFELFKK